MMSVSEKILLWYENCKENLVPEGELSVWKCPALIMFLQNSWILLVRILSLLEGEGQGEAEDDTHNRADAHPLPQLRS